jgi:bifunctional DNase/RNase
MQVKALSPTPDAAQVTVILETPAGDRALGFLIPTNEANRLARVLGLTECRCVPIYELVLSMLAHLCASVTRAVLDADAEGICATLMVRHGDSGFALPGHPADAIALALRANAPTYAAPAALANACALAGAPDREPSRPDVLQWLQHLRPDDFRRDDPEA